MILDCNALAIGQPFFQLGGYEVSPDNSLLAYAQDVIGRRQFQIRFKDLASGALLGDVIENAEPDVAWADDNRTLLYVEKDPVTLLGRRVRAHLLGTPVAADRIVYEEPDESFDLVVTRSKSERHLYIGSESTTSSEWRYARAGDLSLQFAVVVPRAADHEYQIEDLDERMLIRTNWQAQNFRVVAAPLAACGDRASWRDVVPHDPEVFVQSTGSFSRLSRRQRALRRTVADPRAALGRGAVPHRRGRSDVHDAARRESRAGDLVAALRVHLAHDAGDDLRL